MAKRKVWKGTNEQEEGTNVVPENRREWDMSCPPLVYLPYLVNKKPKVGRETLLNKLAEVKLRQVTGTILAL